MISKDPVALALELSMRLRNDGIPKMDYFITKLHIFQTTKLHIMYTLKTEASWIIS